MEGTMGYRMTGNNGHRTGKAFTSAPATGSHGCRRGRAADGLRGLYEIEKAPGNAKTSLTLGILAIVMPWFVGLCLLLTWAAFNDSISDMNESEGFGLLLGFLLILLIAVVASIVMAIISIVFGSMGMKRAIDSHTKGRATAGLVCGCVALAKYLVIPLVYIMIGIGMHGIH